MFFVGVIIDRKRVETLTLSLKHCTCFVVFPMTPGITVLLRLGCYDVEFEFLPNQVRDP